jgi:hypothetical protein
MCICRRVTITKELLTMSLYEREYFVVDADLSEEPEIGRWLWALEDERKRTKARLEGLPSELIDWPPPFGENSIGTLLYHIALIEADLAVRRSARTSVRNGHCFFVSLSCS